MGSLGAEANITITDVDTKVTGGNKTEAIKTNVKENKVIKMQRQCNVETCPGYGLDQGYMPCPFCKKIVHSINSCSRWISSDNKLKREERMCIDCFWSQTVKEAWTYRPR